MIDWSVRRWRAPGVPERTPAASESILEARSSPSASIILARFSRSASACLPIVRLRPSGRLRSLSSTEWILTHQLSDFSSTIALIFSLASFLFARSSSSSNCPTIFRIVVIANCIIAYCKARIFTTDFIASSIAK